ncbi:hypothetical protein OESDEN_23839, partial [Oesophagostomum dentatum]
MSPKMIRFLIVAALLCTALACAPGSGNDIATLTLYTSQP